MADTGVKGWSPYRDMALQEPPRPNWRWRLLAALIPEFIGASRRWYRWTVDALALPVYHPRSCRPTAHPLPPRDGGSHPRGRP